MYFGFSAGLSASNDYAGELRFFLRSAVLQLREHTLSTQEGNFVFAEGWTS
jgi:hypothetical protein